jgi:putative endonuclease
MYLRDPKTYFVHIMSNRSKTLYVGMTNNLMRRVREHKEDRASDFTSRYKLDRLIYFERFEGVRNAIEGEKEIKGLLRIKKIALVVSVNPTWADLSKSGSSIIRSSRDEVHRFFASLRMTKTQKLSGLEDCSRLGEN